MKQRCHGDSRSDSEGAGQGDRVSMVRSPNPGDSPGCAEQGPSARGTPWGQDQSQLLPLRACPGIHPANLPLPPQGWAWARHLSQQDEDPQGRERQGRAPHTSQPQWSFYFLRKCGSKGTKADIQAVPTGRDKNSFPQHSLASEVMHPPKILSLHLN